MLDTLIEEHLGRPDGKAPQTHLFTGPDSLRLHLTRGLAASLEGLGQASLRKCNDADEWVQHLADLQMPVVPALDWGRLKVHALDGQVRLLVPSDGNRLFLSDEAVLLFRMQAMAPLPPGGILGECGINGLVLYMYAVQEFDGIKAAILANLFAMQVAIAEFRPLFCQVLRGEIEARLAQHRYDVQLRDDFMRVLGATSHPGISKIHGYLVEE